MQSLTPSLNHSYTHLFCLFLRLSFSVCVLVKYYCCCLGKIRPSTSLTSYRRRLFLERFGPINDNCIFCAWWVDFQPRYYYFSMSKDLFKIWERMIMYCVHDGQSCLWKSRKNYHGTGRKNEKYIASVFFLNGC